MNTFLTAMGALFFTIGVVFYVLNHDLILFIGYIGCGALVLYGAATMQSRNGVQT